MANHNEPLDVSDMLTPFGRFLELQGRAKIMRAQCEDALARLDAMDPTIEQERASLDVIPAEEQ